MGVHRVRAGGGTDPVPVTVTPPEAGKGHWVDTTVPAVVGGPVYWTNTGPGSGANPWINVNDPDLLGADAYTDVGGAGDRAVAILAWPPRAFDDLKFFWDLSSVPWPQRPTQLPDPLLWTLADLEVAVEEVAGGNLFTAFGAGSIAADDGAEIPGPQLSLWRVPLDGDCVLTRMGSVHRVEWGLRADTGEWTTNLHYSLSERVWSWSNAPPGHADFGALATTVSTPVTMPLVAVGAIAAGCTVAGAGSQLPAGPLGDLPTWWDTSSAAPGETLDVRVAVPDGGSGTGLRQAHWFGVAQLESGLWVTDGHEDDTGPDLAVTGTAVRAARGAVPRPVPGAPAGGSWHTHGRPPDT